jgi:hypothetical protein
MHYGVNSATLDAAEVAEYAASPSRLPVFAVNSLSAPPATLRMPIRRVLSAFDRSLGGLKPLWPVARGGSERRWAAPLQQVERGQDAHQFRLSVVPKYQHGLAVKVRQSLTYWRCVGDRFRRK